MDYVFQKVVLLLCGYKNVYCSWGHPSLQSCARLTHSAICLKFSAFLKFSGKAPRASFWSVFILISHFCRTNSLGIILPLHTCCLYDYIGPDFQLALLLESYPPPPSHTSPPSHTRLLCEQQMLLKVWSVEGCILLQCTKLMVKQLIIPVFKSSSLLWHITQPPPFSTL